MIEAADRPRPMQTTGGVRVRSGAQGAVADGQLAHPGVGAVTVGFTHSAVHEGLILFLSRLVRPVWMRQVVKMNPMNPLETQCLLSRQQVSVLFQPLSRLREVLQKYFADATHRELLTTPEHTTSILERTVRTDWVSVCVRVRVWMPYYSVNSPSRLRRK
jgi:hypothetical protein